jgi:hypothetical protein
MVGSAIPFASTGSALGPKAVMMFRAQLSVLDATVGGVANPVQAYAGFLAEENADTTQGMKYAFAAHRSFAYTPYYAITGFAHALGQGHIISVPYC